MTKRQQKPTADDIVTSSCEDLAWTLSEPTILELTDRDMDALLEAIANPPEPNDAMRRAVARWRELGLDRNTPSPGRMGES